MWINVKNPKILANFHIGLRLRHGAQLRETPLRTYCLYGKKSTCWQKLGGKSSKLSTFNRIWTLNSCFLPNFELKPYVSCQFLLTMLSSIQFCIKTDVFFQNFHKIWLAKNWRRWPGLWQKLRFFVKYSPVPAASSINRSETLNLNRATEIQWDESFYSFLFHSLQYSLILDLVWYCTAILIFVTYLYCIVNLFLLLYFVLHSKFIFKVEFFVVDLLTSSCSF